MQWRAKFKNYLAGSIGDMPLGAITSRTIQEILEPVWANKPSVAQDIVSYANHVFEWAIGMEYISSNPVIKAKKALGGKPRKNGRNHHDAIAHGSAWDYYASIGDVQARNDSVKLALRFLILTATRKEEVLAAKWGEIDFKAKTWTIPGGRGGRMKTGIDHVVPLSNAALALLRESVKDTLEPDAYIFASARKGGEYGVKKLGSGTLNHLVKRVNELTGLSTVPHGFRSTFRDWAAEMTDFPREIAEMCLAHVEGSQAELAYRRTDFLEKRRELMQEWADYLKA